MHESDFDLTQPLLLPERPVFGGRYVLKELLGTGGMSSVWRALEVSLARDVALKFLPISATRDEKARDELKKEVLLSQELTHPNIIRVHSFEEDHTLTAISMELVDGKSLNRLKAGRSHSLFSTTELVPWVEQLCGALTYAHRLDIIHRDIKPGNIMISAKGRVKVVDFGIAASVSEVTTRTDRQPVFGLGGTLAYMSPQQAQGEKPTAADDLYSLGATLYECLTGKPPFFRGEVYSQVLEAVPPSPNRRLAEIDPQLPPIPAYWEDTILACLAKKREDRPASAEAIAALLMRGDLTERVSTATPPKLSPQPPAAHVKDAVLSPAQDQRKSRPIPDRSGAWERAAIALSFRADMYRKTFGLEGNFRERITGVIGTLGLLGFIELALINLSGAFTYGGWFHSGSALFKTFDKWGTHFFTFWNSEKTALSFFAIFLTVQILLVFAVKRMVGFGRVAIASNPNGAMVQSSSGKNLGRTPLLLRLMIPGRYRFRVVIDQGKRLEITGILPKNKTLQLAADFSTSQTPPPTGRG